MLCHQFKCIYIHIPKSAGESIHQIFVRQLGYYRKTNTPLLLGSNNDPRLGPPALGHLKAADYVACGHLPQEAFDSYFKFAFVRNPWARIVSEYKYRGHARKYDFKTFIFKYLPKPGWNDFYYHIIPQYDFLHDHDGKLLVDYLGRFEELQQGFDEVCRQIGLPRTKIPHRNATTLGLRIPRNRPEAMQMLQNSFSAKHKKNTFPHYTQYYDDETREFVAELYKKDIDAFGYRFAPASNPKEQRPD
ncbi:MAG: sulfotransferase family 2 domain-containing protein [Desulfurivibrionaceae bacterium]